MMFLCILIPVCVYFRHSTTLWVDPVDEDSISRIVTTWILTLEKQGCPKIIQAGISSVRIVRCVEIK